MLLKVVHALKNFVKLLEETHFNWKFSKLKFRYSEKATKIWINLPLFFDDTNIKKSGRLFQILWPSQSIWTLPNNTI